MVTPLTTSLTSTFAPSPGCLSDIYRYGANQLLGAQTSSCYPPGWSSQTSVVFSPGVCPSEYTIACLAVSTAGTVTETRATCCPSSFGCGTYTDSPALMCTTHLNGVKSWTVTVMTGPGGGTVSGTTVGAIGGNLNNYGVQIRWQASDMEKTVTQNVTAAPTTSPTTTASPSMSAAVTTAAIQTSVAPTGLSTGAKAGIGVGAALGVLLVAALGIFMVYSRRRKNRTPVEGAGTSASGHVVEKSPQDPPIMRESTNAAKHGVGIQQNSVFEAPSTNEVSELEGQQGKHYASELPGR